MFRFITPLGVIVAMLTMARALPARQPVSGGIDPLDAYNLVWTTPSRDASGSMPIGNGEVGANVWVEEGGDLLLLISRTDSWSEACRLLKIGRVRVHLDPNPFAAGAPFRQELRLRDGRIDIAAGPAGAQARLSILVEPPSPMIRVTGDFDAPTAITTAAEIWRTDKHTLTGQELESSWTMHHAPPGTEVWESADIVLDEPLAPHDGVAWCHHNEHSIFSLTLAHQGLSDCPEPVVDPLHGRMFGAALFADNLQKTSGTTLASPAPVRSLDLRVPVHCARDPDEWRTATIGSLRNAEPAEAARAAATMWWSNRWDRSWIFVEGDGVPATVPGAPPPPSRITQAYILQRWVQACGGRGRYPIKFNGSIFTVEPKYAGDNGKPGPAFNPDWRRWGDCYWWQNTRLPYHPMLAAGDFDLMLPLFNFYESARPLCEARARLYHDAGGAYFPETMTIFGTYSNGDYGWDRAGHEPRDVLCPWWQYAWNQGPELVCLMLDYYDYTRDDRFAGERLLPMARSVLRYFDTRFPRENGRLVLRPTQALETHWHKVVNDAPTIAGLRASLARLRERPAGLVSADDRVLFDRLFAALPPVPTAEESGVRFLSAAESFDPRRQNCESPELYPVFPFRLYGRGKPDLDLAIEAYRRRHDRFTNGWPQDGQDAAILGLTDDAKANILAKSQNSNANYRFPATWGPNFDWLPDQCHGGNLMHMLQLMLIQADGEKIHLFPAWPKEWNVSFRLHAPDNTVVQAVYRNGKVESLTVTPQSRRADVTVLQP